MKSWVVTLLLCLPNSLSRPEPDLFVVWNVGQGSWSTWVTGGHCFHFDMGGDRPVGPKPNQLCGQKKNFLFLTHEDWDHINKINSFKKRTHSLCLVAIFSVHRSFLKRIKKCKKSPLAVRALLRPTSAQRGNTSSVFYIIKGKVLITGDAPKSLEKSWLKDLPKRIRLLLLGHHGSNTSTSRRLLAQTRPQMAIASARKKRYGHPHIKVAQRLRAKKIPLLSTERDGHLYFEF